MLPLHIKILHSYIKNFWYFRGSDDTLIVNMPTIETEEKEIDNEELDNESSEWIVPPTVNYPVKLRLHNRWPSVFTVVDNMIRSPFLYKFKKELFLTDSEKSSLLASLFYVCVNYTL